jgi:endonuclease YncB( thermonuclease family)
MSHIIKTMGCLILAIYFAALLSQAEKQNVPTVDFSKDPCGSPLTVSTAYLSLSGKVIEVLDGDTFILLAKKHDRKTVNLIGVQAPALAEEIGKQSRQHLSEFILNKVVTIYFSSSESAQGKAITALVSTPELQNMSGANIEQLKAGLVKYKEGGASLDWWQACHYKREEQEAREAKRGLWEKASQ